MAFLMLLGRLIFMTTTVAKLMPNSISSRLCRPLVVAPPTCCAGSCRQCWLGSGLDGKSCSFRRGFKMTTVRDLQSTRTLLVGPAVAPTATKFSLASKTSGLNCLRQQPSLIWPAGYSAGCRSQPGRQRILRRTVFNIFLSALAVVGLDVASCQSSSRWQCSERYSRRSHQWHTVAMMPPLSHAMALLVVLTQDETQGLDHQVAFDLFVQLDVMGFHPT